MNNVDLKRVVCVYHSRRQTNNRFSTLLRDGGVDIQEIYIEESDTLPGDSDRADGFISFGGTNSVNDGLESTRAELYWIERLFRADARFLGICFGAQLMAKVLGATVEPHPEGKAEIGYYKVNPTDRGRTLFSTSRICYQWHREGFAVPAGATLLATGDIFPVQAIGFRNATGLMFHPEATADIIKQWLEIGHHRLNLPGAQNAATQLELASTAEPKIEDWSKDFLAKWSAGQFVW